MSKFLIVIIMYRNYKDIIYYVYYGIYISTMLQSHFDPVVGSLLVCGTKVLFSGTHLAWLGTKELKYGTHHIFDYPINKDLYN